MSEVQTQVEETKQLPIVKPTDKNFEVFGKYRSGMSINELAEEYELTDKAIYHHIDRVKSFLGDSWQKFTLADMKLEYAPVRQSFRDLVSINDSKTVNNYLNKMVYPDRSKGTAIQLNVNNIVGSMSSNAGYDVDAEVIEDNGGDNG